MRKKSMLLSFTSLLIILLCFYGCASTWVVPIRYPTTPPKPVVEPVKLYPFELKDLSFKEESGKDSITIDNVTVRVDSIVSEMKSKDYTVELKDLEGKTYHYSMFPMMIVLKIPNKTDRIVRLDRTIVRVEDEKQEEYPMIQTTRQNKDALKKRIMKMYDDYGTNVASKYCAQEYIAYLNGPYASQYRLMIADIQEDIKQKNEYDAGDVTCAFWGVYLG